MKLDEWLRARKMSDTAFAGLVDVSQQLVGMWRRGQRRPSAMRITAIEYATAGEVKAADFEKKGKDNARR